jgi:hypothetical protein
LSPPQQASAARDAGSTTTPDSGVPYAEIEYAGSASGTVRADTSILYLDQVTS